jgi:hypothetical protein
MLRTTSVLALAVAALATPAMAAPVNPWHPAQTTVPIIITVEQMVELYTNTANVPLSIADAGENGGSTRAVERTLYHLHNVPVNVFAQIDGNIPNWTQFHILINANTVWVDGPSSDAEKTISWRRDAGGYIPADGAFDNQVSATGINTPVLAFSAAANNPTASDESVQYFADARNGMPAYGVNPTFNVVWTIASTAP